MTLENKIQKHTEEALKKKAQKLSIIEGSAFSVMDGFGLRYITPYALALGASNAHIGLLNSLPFLLGSIAELPIIKAMKYHTRKTLVFWGVLLQSLLWLPIIGISILFSVFGIDHGFAPAAVIAVFTLLMIAGAAPTPAWSSWMKDIVPLRYNNYFGTRNKILGFVAIASMLIAGWILDYFRANNVLIGFGIIFFIAFLGRFTSSQLFLRAYEPKMTIDNRHKLHFGSFMKTITKTNFGKYALLSSLMGFAVAIASPFFAVYMLQELQLNYLQFTLVSLSSLIVMFFTMPLWGKFADKYGNCKVIKNTSFMIPLVPIFWLATPFVANFNHSYVVPFLIIIEAYSGLVWAGYNLSTADFIYDAGDHEQVAAFMAYSSILNNSGVFLGALIGGWIASQDILFFGLSAILVGFLISGILRYIVASALAPKICEVRVVKRFNEKKLQFLHINLGKLARFIR